MFLKVFLFFKLSFLGYYRDLKAQCSYLNVRKIVSLQFFMLQNRAYWEVYLCTSRESGGEYEVGAVELDIRS